MAAIFWNTLLIERTLAPSSSVPCFRLTLLGAGLRSRGWKEQWLENQAPKPCFEPLARLVDTVQRVQERLNKELRLLGLVACRVDNRTNHSPEVVRLLRERFGDKVYNVSIRENIRIAEAPGFKQPITLYDPQGRGAEDYRQLAAELEHREGANGSETDVTTG